MKVFFQKKDQVCYLLLLVSKLLHLQQDISNEKGVELEEDAADQSTEPSEFGEILRERIQIMTEEKKERAKKIARQVQREINLKKIITEDL